MFAKILNAIGELILSILFGGKNSANDATPKPSVTTTLENQEQKPMQAQIEKPIEAPAKPKESKLIPFCLAIQSFEGYYPNSRSFNNRNPGNIRYIGQKAAIGQDHSGFCIFPTYEIGFQALKDLIIAACSGKSRVYSPDMTLLSFFSKYAPTSDNNDPNAYANFVAKKIGELPTFRIRDLF